MSDEELEGLDSKGKALEFQDLLADYKQMFEVNKPVDGGEQALNVICASVAVSINESESMYVILALLNHNISINMYLQPFDA